MDDAVTLTPFIFATFAQPHSLLSCHQGAQKLELSCYDVVLKGACADSCVKGRCPVTETTTAT